MEILIFIQKAISKFANKIKGNNEQFANPSQMIDRAIQGLMNGEDTEYIISLLKKAKVQ